MNDHPPESDWKRSRVLHKTALDRLCAGALKRSIEIAIDTTRSNHERFLELYHLINDRNDDIARVFDGASRSKCVGQLGGMLALDLLTDDEVATLTPETADLVRRLAKFERSTRKRPDGRSDHREGDAENTSTRRPPR